MPSIKGTVTEKNLQKAFEKEAEARMLYYIFAQQAKLEGYEHISQVFQKFADNEREHSRIWFKWLNENKFPLTLENIETALKNETYEAHDGYLKYAQTAKEEGLEELAKLFKFVADVEHSHEKTLKQLYLSVKNENIQPNPDGTFKWVCSACGCIIEQETTPDYCPLCAGEDIFFYKN